MAAKFVMPIVLALLLTSGGSRASALDLQDLIRETPYADIDVQLQNRAVDELRKEKGIRPEGLFKHILAHPDIYSPAVMFVLSDKLYESDRRTEAMFWFYAALLRAQYDANRCTDESVHAALKIMATKFGGNIEPYAREQLPTFRQIIVHVTQFEYDTPHNYDHRWINLHGMRTARAVKAAQNGMSLRDDQPFSLPAEDWPKIHRETVEAFRQEMEQRSRMWAQEQGPR